MAISTKPPSGFRDFLPAEVRRRDAVLSVVREVFDRHGFDPLETPAMERLSTLTGKYGEEGDQLLFRVMKRADKLERVIESGGASRETLADAGLRYDLTVPLARVIAEHKNDLPRPFKRYQIAPVWRADRPQRGRYREFYQCDVDVVGTDSLVAEAEVIGALAAILERLGLGEECTIQLNHRGLLDALLEDAAIPEALRAGALVALDKLDKIGADRVRAELVERGISAPQAERLMEGVGLGDLDALAERLGEAGRGPIEALRMIGALCEPGPAARMLRPDASLARGLSYYTGAIFEISAPSFGASLGGGGRYDELIGMFGKERIPACGFSLGIERILLLLEERASLSEGVGLDVVVALADREGAPGAMALAASLRGEGLRVDVYPDPAKLSKQFKYADARGARLVALCGERERARGAVALKRLDTGDQIEIDRASVPARAAQLVAEVRGL